MITFKQFLLEGGKETAVYGTVRAYASDIRKAIEIISKTLGKSEKYIEDNLLGSSKLTLSGRKKDSGDVDISYPIEQIESANNKMLKLVNGEGRLNPGTKVGSYAVDLSNKKIQVDLMFSEDIEWSKFAYYSPENSKYSGAARNIILATVLAHTQTPGKDFIIRDKDGMPIVRASLSMNLGKGVQRMFKMRKKNKNGEWLKTMQTVTPEEIRKEFPNEKFSSDSKIITDPNWLANYLFPGSTSNDIMTAEDILSLVKKRKDSKEILNDIERSLKKAKIKL